MQQREECSKSTTGGFLVGYPMKGVPRPEHDASCRGCGLLRDCVLNCENEGRFLENG